jgi:hypothetical protein
VRAAALIAVVIVAAGCEKKFNEEYCLNHGDDPAYAAYCHADGAVPPDIIVPDGPPGTHHVIGAVDGLATGTLVLTNNGSDDKTLTMNGAFYFDMALTMGAPYDVTVKTQPDPLTCSVMNGRGTMGSEDVSNVVVHCVGDLGIKCGTGFCAVGDSCCYATGVCNSVTTCSGVKLSCDDSADCGGTNVCCGELNAGSQPKDAVCKATVADCLSGNANNEIFCDPDVPGGDPACMAGQMCKPAIKFVGYHSCQ